MQNAMNLHTYIVDQSHSSVQFRVRHLGFSKVSGRFLAFEATLQMNPVSLRTLHVEARIQAASISTGDEDRDAHLRSPDFLDAARYPSILFQSRDVIEAKVDSFQLRGDLTMHGVTRPVVLSVLYLGEAQDLTGKQRVAFEATTKINRKDYGLTWNNVIQTGGLLVGETVEVMLDIQAVRAAPVPTQDEKRRKA